MSLRCALSFSNIPSYIVRHVFGVKDALDQRRRMCVVVGRAGRGREGIMVDLR